MEPSFPKRVALLVLAVATAALLIGARLYEIQVARATELKARAHRQHEQRIVVEGRRGSIVDRFGRELAVSVESYSLFVHPWKVQQPEAAARRLAPVIGLPAAKILERLRSEAPFVWLARRLDAETAAAVRKLDLPLGSGEPFGFETEGRRDYPQGPMAAHVLGFANIDQRGVEGIELALDRALLGDSTTYLAVRDGRGGMFLKLVKPPSRQPDDVVLSLDLVLQHMLERELDAAIRDTGAAAATAVLMDPTTGEVLALANRPNADPNQYGKATLAEKRDRAVADLYEPGSTFKVVTAAAALDQGVVRPSDPFDCENGVLVVGPRIIHDHHPYGILSFREVIEKSSNIGMIKVGRRLSDDVFYSYIRRFGFGRKLGIELPGEAAGLVAGPSRWTPSTHASISFGHEIAVTPLQVTTAIAAVANDGVLVPPRIVMGMRDALGSLRPAPSGEPRRVISSQTARTLADLLEGVVVRGTGKQAAVPGYRIAGKTGTAQKVLSNGRNSRYSDSEFIASFAGFGPVRSPRLAGVVVLDTPSGGSHTGGVAAAPVFSKIMAAALAYLRVPPDEDVLLARRAAMQKGTSDDEPVSHSVKMDDGSRPEPFERVASTAGQVPDLRGMSLRSAVNALTARRYRALADGRGIVVKQDPPPGTSLEEGRTCSLTLLSGDRATP